jgi:hypothetical protein
VRAGRSAASSNVRIALSVPLRQLDAGDFSHGCSAAAQHRVRAGAASAGAAPRADREVREAHTTLLSTRELMPASRSTIAGWWPRAASAQAEIYLAFGQSFTRNTIEVLGSDGEVEADLFHNLVAGETKTLSSTSGTRSWPARDAAASCGAARSAR